MMNKLLAILLLLGVSAYAASDLEAPAHEAEAITDSETSAELIDEDLTPLSTEQAIENSPVEEMMSPLKVAHNQEPSIQKEDILKHEHEPSASFMPAGPGNYEFEVTVTDGCATFSDTVTYDVVCAHQPIAFAGENTHVRKDCQNREYVSVQLDGTRSQINGRDYLAKWSFCDMPDGSELVESDLFRANMLDASFVPDKKGVYCLRLDISDCCGTSSSTVDIVYECNAAPVAALKLVGDKQVFVGETVELDASQSFDADKDFLSYEYRFVKVPDNSDLTDADFEIDFRYPQFARFKPDVKGSYMLSVDVSDCCQTVSSALVFVQADCNQPPNANIGRDEDITGIQTVYLDGSQSLDPDDTKLVFTWSFIKLPPASNLTDSSIVGYNVDRASFLPDVLGVYEVQVDVSDCCSTCQARKRIVIGCNGSPYAFAGADKTITANQPFPPVEIDGCESGDPDEDPLAFQWEFVSVPRRSLLDSKSIDNPHSCKTVFTPDVTGMFELRLTVTDNCATDSDTVLVILGCNKLPVADAGEDKLAKVTCDSTQIIVDGSNSYDPDEDPIDFEWKFHSIPSESKITDSHIMDSQSKIASFTPDVKGSYDLTLTVSDGCTRNSDVIRILYTCSEKPVARAGRDEEVRGKFPWRDPVVVDASGSYDPAGGDESSLKYEWRFVTVPDNSALSTSLLESRRNARTSFTPDVEGRYELEVAVSDCCSTATDRVVMTVTCGLEPTANAGYDVYKTQECDGTDTVIDLDGTLSSDQDSDELTFRWSILRKPEHSTVTDMDIDCADCRKATFTLSPAKRIDHSDVFVVQLTVSDSCRSVTDHVQITWCCNDKPTAHAGRDITFAAVPPFHSVQLDGSHSYDSAEDLLSYVWTFQSIAPGSLLQDGDIAGSNTALAEFIPDVRGPYTLQLAVSDCCSTVFDKVHVTVTCDEPPVVNFCNGRSPVFMHRCDGPDTIVIDAGCSTDPDHEVLSYHWSFINIPDGSEVSAQTIENQHAQAMRFTADVVGVYEVRVEVSDGCSTVSDTVRAEVQCDGRPTARAGDLQSIVGNPPFQSVRLDGSGSEDPAGAILKYSWSFRYTPPGSNLRDSDINLNQPYSFGGEFVPDTRGCYDLELHIDGCCGTDTAETRVCLSCNDAPVANAGKDQTYVKGKIAPLVELDGCESEDPDVEKITYLWRFSRQPALSLLTDRDIVSATSCKAAFTPDSTGEYELELTVYDGCSQSRDRAKVKYRCNDTPIARAGPSRSVEKSCSDSPQIAYLDGSGSFDPDSDDELLYAWSFDLVPDGSGLVDANIFDRTRPQASFVPDVYGTYELLLTVHDYCFTITDKTFVTFHCNEPPNAHAGADQSFSAWPFPEINLSGTADDPDDEKDSLTYLWKFVSKPTDSKLKDTDIIDSNRERAIFIPDVAGAYALSFEVSDCCSTTKDQVRVTVNRKGCNASPSANAGSDIELVKTCTNDQECTDCNVILDGSNSVDPENDQLSYKWTFLTHPEHSLLTSNAIQYSSSAIANFKPDRIGEYKLILVVSDGCSTASDEVLVHFKCNGKPRANAGENVVLDVGGSEVLPMVSVNGDHSSDPDGDMLDYSWSILKKAEGSCMDNSKLRCVDSHCSFQPDVLGCYNLELTVSDCCNVERDEVQICLVCNSAPEPFAGEDVEIFACPPYDSVKLHGIDQAGKTHSDAQWQWVLISQPAYSKLTDKDILFSHTSNPEFTPDARGEYQLELRITDSCGTSKDQVLVMVGCNQGPVAMAGEDQNQRWDGRQYPKVTLDGSSSHDPEDDPITYHWHFKSKPRDSQLHDDSITNRDSSLANFWPDIAGVYEVELEVMDCCTTARDIINVHVGCNGAPTVDVGADQTIKKSCDAAVVTLTGQTQDPEGDDITLEWSFTNIPLGSKLSDSKIVTNGHQATFDPDVTGSFFEVQLCATDGCSTTCDRAKVEYECNEPPQANAGEDKFFIKECGGQTIYLDGSASYDPDPDDTLRYKWEFKNKPEASNLTNADIFHSNSATPNFIADAIGLYEVMLTVYDCCDLPAIRCTCMRDRVLVKLDCTGSPPTANAGEDKLVHWNVRTNEFPEAFLDGTASSDEDKERLYYKWSFVSVPQRSTLVDSSIYAADQARARFAPDVNGEYEVELTVSDCCYSSTDRIKITVRCDNPPTVRAGDDQHLHRACNVHCTQNACPVSAPVFLDGSGSKDPEGEPLICSWKFTCMPARSHLTDKDITMTDNFHANFNADVLGEYVVEYTCYDGCSYVSDDVSIKVGCNSPPVASAVVRGTDKTSTTLVQQCGVTERIVIDASGAHDPENDPLQFTWSFHSLPEASKLKAHEIDTMGDENHSFKDDEAFFTPDVVGIYVVELQVSDCCNSDSQLFTVNVHCSVAPTAIAGEARTIEWDGIESMTLTLDGSLSSDVDSNEVRYDWELLEKPTGSLISQHDIRNAKREVATFSPDDFGCYQFKLAVSDCCNEALSYTEICVVCSNTTSADAGADRRVAWECGSDVPLEVAVDGSVRKDDHVTYNWELLSFNGNSVPDVDAGCELEGEAQTIVRLEDAVAIDLDNQDTLAYAWSIVELPRESGLGRYDVVGRHNLDASFVPDVSGRYIIQLEATDGYTSAMDRVTVNVREAQIGSGLSAERVIVERVAAEHSSAIEHAMFGLVGFLGLCVAGLGVATVKLYRKNKELMGHTSASTPTSPNSAALRRDPSSTEGVQVRV